MISLNRIPETILSLTLSFLIADGFMFIITWLVNKLFPNVLPLLITALIQTVITLIWSFASTTWFFKTHKPTDCVIVYDEFKDFEQLIYDYGYDKKFNVKNIITVDECLSDLDLLNEAEAVFLSDIHSHERNFILKRCIMNNKTVYVIPRLGDVIMSGAKSMHIFHMPLLRVSGYTPGIEYMIVKRTLDVIFSLLGLIISSPLMLIIALAIKLNDKGEVFYKQVRLTKDGKRFELIKFRSMIVDAEDDGVARLSLGENDDRITKVGRVIRKLRLDELPQLVNVLRGEMTFIGPRPERPEIAEMYEKVIPEFSLRLQAKAGLTGYAQVYGKYNTTPYNKLQMDLQYIANPSIFEDLRIFLATVKILFMPESTDGINEGITALENEEVQNNRETDIIF